MIRPGEIWENKAGIRVLIERRAFANPEYVYDGTHYYHHETGKCASRSPSDGRQRDLYKFVKPAKP